MNVWKTASICILIALTLYGCIVTRHGDTYEKILTQPLGAEELGKAKFLHGDMGGIYPHTLQTNAFVYKLATVALAAVDSTSTTQESFRKFGFVYSRKIWNWKGSPITPSDKPTGLIFGKLTGRHPLKGKFVIETADFGCGACHGGPRYDKNGLPTDEFVLGMPNTSFNLQGYANELFEGYKIIIQWNNKKFKQKILELYPDIPEEELTGLEIIFKSLKKEVGKIVATRGQVAPYKIGGPGTMNGVGAIKNGLGMLDNSYYHKDEISAISIPALADRSFRSSFLVSGNYTPEGNEFFYEITVKDTSDRHDQEMASIIALFTIGTMGYNKEMAAKSLPEVKDVMKFLSKVETPPFPGELNMVKAGAGKLVYQKNCETCHGKYEGTGGRNKMVSFPNQFFPLAVINTDPIRANAITEENLLMLNKMKLKKYFDAKVNIGYVAPILTGVWATAPYFHNGSVPTLWHLMHPEERPEKFYVGGHQLDYEKVGIMGEMKNGVYQYPEGYKNWAGFEIYNTNEPGMSNKGHIEPFKTLTEEEKENLLEFMKTI